MNRKSSYYIRASTILLGFLLLAACNCVTSHPKITLDTPPPKPKIAQKNIPLVARKGPQLWDRIRDSYQLNHNTPDPKVQYYVKQFSNSEYLEHITSRGAPYLYLIVEALERRNLPGELVFLPMVESAYNPKARSEKGAAGLWQMMPETAKRFGLKRNHWYDGRMDVAASTEAALDYLDYLKDLFKEDWLLALAAYNSGEGKVSRSIARNKQRERSTDFWELGLPKQTKDYVPKILALAKIIRDPKAHGVELPILADVPYLAEVQLDAPLHFNAAAKLAGISVKELKKLNPGHHLLTYHPRNTSTLLLPIEKVDLFLAQVQAEYPSVSIAKVHPKPSLTKRTITLAAHIKRLFMKG